jgi:hypothetical protein
LVQLRLIPQWDLTLQPLHRIATTLFFFRIKTDSPIPMFQYGN